MVKNNLLRWNTYYPCLKGEIHPFLKFDKPSVVFYASFKSTIPEKERDELENEMLEFYDTLSENVKQCFGDPLFKSIEIKPQDDTHVTGARLLVEALFDVEKPLLPDAQYILIMEHDLRAIRKNWLGKLILETAWPQLMFWIKGSIYRGKLSLVEGTTYIPNLYHINGGCIYNVGDVEFREFYRSVRSYIVKKHGDSPNAYDTDFFEWSIDVANYDKFRHVAHMFRYTDVIQNQWISPYYIPDINRKSPNTHLIHGGNIQSNPL
ncbi:hypothetical protein ROZALSC1DRAFT_29051 [Rozella allomycis CSF55]|uniref:Uncharacterized protein n=1 Tax=Rozella allomycis (strain CSF55) TaxID=988480 RepID=A0A075B3P9_ROZAC|nr:hypothetical protein O9G_003946 [Rozella allomycis CSF55]RKP19348.1 hypothetical protein ROZALSC1DRAFT_29051 [Rozella allomycis CSF55]|eukprot:EPZ35513.1 hypothetical protein O9G_003946 [Rozella allomycis CSF55]